MNRITPMVVVSMVEVAAIADHCWLWLQRTAGPLGIDPRLIASLRQELWDRQYLAVPPWRLN